MGFRDLGVFNQALLAKQCWCIIKKPDSLAAMVLKGCYFEDCSFMFDKMAACNDRIPTMFNLANWKVCVDGLCPNCKRSPEMTAHALWECSKLNVIRNECRFMEGMRCNDKVSFCTFFQSCLLRLNEEKVAIFCVILWRIWFIRNHGLFEDGGVLADSIYTWSGEFLSGFKAANEVGAAVLG
ncbi:hypothetical protein Dsin_024212 [Dipteronia sinensis]|uniref:Reverse transcriptase zinc-binding domain-containing protein n=1 Tax=Dipteronia sinensis TaxID=43782 RepID=A0AAE0A5P4_9ROSI|nr:hypothetical protein Dsin_024212 [Dipteronia sinensis]